MKILLISPTHSGIGGIAQHVQGLETFLKNKGNNVEIISSENTFTIPIKGLKNPSFMISSSLKAKFKKNNDIVHAHNIPSAKAMKNASGKKILTIHGIYSQQVENLHNKTTSKIAANFEKEALEWANAITVVSKDAFDYYKKLGLNVYHIPNSINIDSLSTKSDRRYKKQIIFAGRLSSEKGIDVLLDLIQILPSDIHLIILGSGPKENLIKNIKKPNVDYLGYLPKNETISLIRGSDILIQPSLIEGISSTILEAMACKVPVITTNVGGNKEIIENNKTGILIEPTSQKLLEEIKKLFVNYELKNRLIDSAYANVQKYDWKNVGKLYLNLYIKLLKS